MLNKITRIVGITIGVFGILYILLRAIGYIGFYKVPTTGMYPSLKPGDYFFVTKFIKPKRGDIYVYNTTFENRKNEKIVRRIAAVAGDTLALIDGYLFVNHQLCDINYSIALPYLVPIEKQENRPEEFFNMNTIPFNAEYSIQFLTKQEAEKNNYTIAVREIESNDYNDSLLFMNKQLEWKIGNYGPIVIPQNKFFFLGDNRYNSYDSRYTGYVDKADLIGGVLIIL